MPSPRFAAVVLILFMGACALAACDDAQSHQSPDDVADLSPDQLSPDSQEDLLPPPDFLDLSEPDILVDTDDGSDVIAPPDLVDGSETTPDPDLSDVTDFTEIAELLDTSDTAVTDTLTPDLVDPGSHLVYQLNGNGVAEDALIDVSGVIVTGVNTTETLGHPIFVQLPPTDPDYAGPDGSGLYIYIRKTDFVPAVGDLINVRGKVVNESGWAWLNYGRGVEVLSSGNALPAPIVVPPAAIATGGARQIALQAVRVQVDHVRVTDLAPAPSPGDSLPTQEFAVTGNLLVDDFLFLATTPRLDDHFIMIRGILHHSFGASRLLPTAATDLVRHPRLARFEPATETLQVGSQRELRLYIDQVWPQDLTVALSYGSAALSGPATLTIPSNSLSAAFFIDGLAPAAAVTIAASLDGESLSASVQVVDAAQVAVARLTPEFQKWARNSTTAFTVELAGPAPQGGQTVYIDSSGANYDKVEVPTSVLVPAGESRVDVPVLTKSGTGTALLSAYTLANTAPYPSTEIQVVPSYPRGLLLAQVLYNPIHDDDQREWIVLYNATGTRVDLGSYELRMANNNNPNFTSTLYRTALPAQELAIGACFVVGGPQSDADNGAPVYHHAVDLNPDLVNATSAQSAAVALFTTAGVQLDTVIYGGDGTNPGNIRDEGGSSSVDVANSAVSAGASIRRRQDNQWEATAPPTPNLCPPF